MDLQQLKLLTGVPCGIGRKHPDIHLHLESGTTDKIIRHIEAGRINLGRLPPHPPPSNALALSSSVISAVASPACMVAVRMACL